MLVQFNMRIVRADVVRSPTALGAEPFLCSGIPCDLFVSHRKLMSVGIASADAVSAWLTVAERSELARLPILTTHTMRRPYEGWKTARAATP